MINRRILLCPDVSGASLDTYISEDAPGLNIPPRDALIICAGGAYVNLSPREAEPVAKVFFAAGLNVFILNYSIGEGASEGRPLIEASFAVRHIREHAAEYRIQPDRIFILGFSAGGHLAASIGTMWNSERLAPYLTDAAPRVNRPDGMLLAYPVISYRHPHRRSFEMLCNGKNPSEEELRAFSVENFVDDDTCPAFLWHTVSDESVPVENSLVFASALKAHRIPFELHIFPEGPHGLSLANRETSMGKPELEIPHVACWTELALRWISDFRTK